MQVIMRLSQEKEVVDDAGSVNIVVRAQRVIEGLAYNTYNFVDNAMPEVGTPHCPIPPMVNIIPETCHSPLTHMPPREVYTYL